MHYCVRKCAQHLIKRDVYVTRTFGITMRLILGSRRINNMFMQQSDVRDDCWAIRDRWPSLQYVGYKEALVNGAYKKVPLHEEESEENESE